MDIKEMKNDPRRLHHVAVDADKCMGCKKCMKTCCYDVYKWDSEKNVAIAAYSEECVACLQCMFFCPSGAITVKQSTTAFYDPLYDPFGINDEVKEVKENG